MLLDQGYAKVYKSISNKYFRVQSSSNYAEFLSEAVNSYIKNVVVLFSFISMH